MEGTLNQWIEGSIPSALTIEPFALSFVERGGLYTVYV